MQKLEISMYVRYRLVLFGCQETLRLFATYAIKMRNFDI